MVCGYNGDGTNSELGVCNKQAYCFHSSFFSSRFECFFNFIFLSILINPITMYIYAYNDKQTCGYLNGGNNTLFSFYL